MSPRKSSRKSGKHLQEADSNTPSANPAWFGWWIFFCLVLILQREITSPGLWWELSRGRAVAAGSLTPSLDLLALETQHDADWLGGLPFYVVWSLGGIHALAAVPLLAGILLARRFRAALLVQSPLQLFLLFPLMLYTVRDQLQPVPQLLDLFAFCYLTEQLRRRTHPLSTWHVGLLFAVWMNLAPGPIWGLLWLVAVVHTAGLPKTSANSLRLIVAAFVGGMLSPRGVFGWLDSARLAVPNLFVPMSRLVGEHIMPGFVDLPLTFMEVVFAILWAGCVGHLGIRFWFNVSHDEKQPTSKYLLFYLYVVPVLGVLCSRENIPICGLWLYLTTGISAATGIAAQPPNLGFSKIHRGWLVAGALVASFTFYDALFITRISPNRISWGISQAIDHRTLDLPGPIQPDSSAIGWAPDERSVGIVTWKNAGVQMADHPLRALLGHRVRDHLLLTQDLKSGHRARYRREDGSWGGWVRTVTTWNIECLFLPVEQLAFNHSLVTSTWRPCDLDSPTIPYSQAESRRFSSAILETLQQQGFVELGPWQPTLDIYDGRGWRLDFVNFWGSSVAPGPAIRQSQIFRAMDLPAASLRALLPVRQHSRTSLLESEFGKCQRALAFQEWTTFGDASRFRKLLVRPGDQLFPWIAQADSSPGEWSVILDHYIQGALRAAIDACDGNDDQQRYAIAMMWLELGDLQECQQALAPLLSAGDTTIRVAANYWQSQISQFVDE